MNNLNQTHKYHYNYKIINSETNEFYIGVRSCDCEIEQDKYMGSSSIWDKKYIQENFEKLKKEILAVFKTRIEATDNEVILLQQYKEDPLCINLYFDKTPDLTGTHQTPEHIEKRKMYGEKNGMYGKHHTEEVKEKISNSLKGRVFSEEHKQKIGAKHKGKIFTEESKRKSRASKAIMREIEDLKTGEIFIMNVPDFCEFHPEYNATESGLNYAARKSGVYKGILKIKNYEASTGDSSRKLGENGETPEVDNPVGSTGNE